MSRSRSESHVRDGDSLVHFSNIVEHILDEDGALSNFLVCAMVSSCRTASRATRSNSPTVRVAWSELNNLIWEPIAKLADCDLRKVCERVEKTGFGCVVERVGNRAK